MKITITITKQCSPYVGVRFERVIEKELGLQFMRIRITNRKVVNA